MARQETVDRRTALETLGAVVAVATGASTAGAATGDASRSAGPRDTGMEAVGSDREQGDTTRPDGEDDAGTDLTGLYTGTVDRIVDGEHVVILVEEGGSVVDQYVVPAAEYPFLEEGDPVGLLVWFGRLLAVWKRPEE